MKIINENGGKMPNAVGVPEDQLRQAAKLSVCKINIDSDLRLAMTGTIREFFNEHPDKFDPREYLKPARANIKERPPKATRKSGSLFVSPNRSYRQTYLRVF